MTNDVFDLSGRTALITGASTGLGWAMANAMAERGAKVLITSRSTLPPKGKPITCGSVNHIGCFDLAVGGQVKAMAAAVEALTPSLDILVNNAGVYSTAGVDNTDSDTWDLMFDANLKSVFFVTRALLPLLEAAAVNGHRSRIINIGSVVGQYPAPIVPYALSKSGVHHLTKILGNELARKSINVNAIAPAAFRTPATQDQLDQMGEAMAKVIPVGRLGTDSDIAGAAIFFASKASEFITGHVLPLDGGYAEFIRNPKT